MECYLFWGSYFLLIKIVVVLFELNLVVVYVGENYEIIELLWDFIVFVLKRKSG